MGKPCPACFTVSQVKSFEGKTGPYLIALKQDRKMRGNFQSEGMNRGTRRRSEHRGLQQTAQNRRGQAHSQVSKVSARRMTKRRERFAELAEPRQLKIPQLKPILEKRTCSRRTERAGRIFYYMLSYSDFFFFFLKERPRPLICNCWSNEVLLLAPQVLSPLRLAEVLSEVLLTPQQNLQVIIWLYWFSKRDKVQNQWHKFMLPCLGKNCS